MRIAVTSQNRHSVTGHAGKCRKFWLYTIADGAIASKQLLELPIEQSLHAQHDELSDALRGIDVLISGGMGAGLHQRLQRQGIQPLLTAEADPDAAVNALLTLKSDAFLPPPTTACTDHQHAPFHPH
ncbi:MAG: NifB/NifX family molybdenum-iron cluster-binding protein [Dechloromonas sp.]|nr:NifB/NifX family molybdenum-iron cluster-binding protein [Dechloromonas sp.]